MAASAQAPRGLTAAELAAACAELQQHRDAVVLEAIPLAVPAGADDLLLVLGRPDDARAKSFLHVAPGGPRARVTLTTTRFPATAFARGPARDLLQKELAGARFTHVAAADGERRCALHFATGHGDRRLVVELFGARGLWALLDAEGRAVVLSRVVETAVRTLRLHDPYAPPPPGSGPRDADPPPRFSAPVLAAIDAHFRPLDLHAEGRAEHEVLVRAASRALQKAKAKAQGIGQQLADTGRAQSYRDRADLMLAYAHTVPRGATTMRVPDPERDGEERTLELDPAKPVVVQARTLYDKARALDDGRAIAERRFADAEAEIATLQPLVDALAAVTPDAADLVERLAPIRSTLQQLGALPKPKAATAPTGSRQKPVDHPHENFRRYASAEGYPIWVGRNNEQNDRLTLRIANGNDLWLHVGGGRAGSHVVVRLPKGKTASLETLLDAGTLAVHFSKARGESRIDVVYTQKKHVRKPKGLPAGAVVPSQTKTITVLRDEARLARLLGGAGPDDDLA
jgi:predicted ribosome quality control (RQC) complex YloA/Tae2 family protein